MKRKGPARDASKERFWRAAIGQQRRSGQSIRAYCREHDLSEASFYAWRGELKRRRAVQAEKAPPRSGSGARFLPVRLAAGSVSPPGLTSIEVALPGGVVLRLPMSMEPERVATMLIAWERGRC
jgi:transposase-like protein